MLAGGTGITPMYQVAQHLLKDPRDKTKLSLVYGSLTEDDILLRAELDALVEKHPDRFRVYHVLNTPPSKDWKGGSGFITREVIEQQLPKPAGAAVAVLRCGPPAMNDAMGAHLSAIGYEEQALFTF
jgi:cytochrome-b5 reductase